jgi:transcriptional regulator with XRE-family HTH domain
MMTLAERLVSIREENGYTRKRLSDELGKPYATITKYENGQREPGHDYLLLIAEKFGVTVDYILGLETKKAPTENGERKVTDDDIKAAFWGGEKDLSQEDIDALWEDARAYIEFKTSQKRGKKRR